METEAWRPTAEGRAGHGVPSAGWWARRVGPLAVCLALLCNGCALFPALQTQGRSARPPFWVVESASGARLYLLGSVHTGEAGGWTYPRGVNDAFAESLVLVVEVDDRDTDPAEMVALFRKHALLPDALRLSSVVSPETVELMDATLPTIGVSSAALEHYEPWFASMALVELASAQMGLDQQAGVDRAFLSRVSGQQRVVALETAEEQVLIMDSLPAAVQDLMLRDTLLGLEDLDEQIERLLAAWRSGDDERLTALVFEGLEDEPEFAPFYEAVFFDRNQRMANRFDTMIASGGVVFGVVGAGHLLGDQGVPALLRERGHRVERVNHR